MTRHVFDRSRRSQTGFTLIEMAVVLIVIGIIIATVVKGGDLMQSAKQKKFYTKFFKPWQLSLFQYYDRTGNVLADGVMNGGVDAAKDGKFDDIAGDRFGDPNGVNDALKRVGLTVPATNTASSGQYTYKGRYSGPQTVTLHLSYASDLADGTSGNVLYLADVPTDLAVSLDTIVDGELDGKAGGFRRDPDDEGWPDASSTATVNAQLILNIP